MNHAKQSAKQVTQVRQFLMFCLGSEEYGIDILKVQEIRGYGQVTRIANTPAFIKGVTNLRGAIVPILDLRIKFDVSEATYDEHTVVIIVNIGERQVGIVVDGVLGVTSLGQEEIAPPPEFSVSLPLEYLIGLGNLERGMLVLVDIEKLLTSEELALVDKATTAS
jgi:purine-binding chemotaxis protein CheW